MFIKKPIIIALKTVGPFAITSMLGTHILISVSICTEIAWITLVFLLSFLFKLY